MAGDDRWGASEPLISHGPVKTVRHSNMNTTEKISIVWVYRGFEIRPMEKILIKPSIVTAKHVLICFDQTIALGPPLLS
jgi:hypothetical protein